MRGLSPIVKILCLVGAVIVIGGCVSEAEFNKVKGLNRQMADTIERLTNERDKALAENAKLKSDLAKLNADFAMGGVEAQRWKDKYEAAQAQLDKVLAELEKQPAAFDMKALEDFAKKYGYKITKDRISLPADIFFDSGKVTLKAGVTDQLKELAQILSSDFPSAELAIEGHTDNVPIKVSGWADNWQLACERARTILNVLEKEGVPSEKMRVVGYSMYKPEADNSTKEGKAKNRRVELHVVPKAAPAE